MHPALRKGPLFYNKTHPHFPLFFTKKHPPPISFPAYRPGAGAFAERLAVDFDMVAQKVAQVQIAISMQPFKIK